MKHITFAFLVLSGSTALHAKTVELTWDKICELSVGDRLMVTTMTGETLQGSCTLVRVDQVALSYDRHFLRIIDRNSVSRLHVLRPKGSQTAGLWKGVAEFLRFGTKVLFSRAAPTGAVIIPVSLAWGAVATPFCLLADIANRLAGEDEIKVN